MLYLNTYNKQQSRGSSGLRRIFLFTPLLILPTLFGIVIIAQEITIHCLLSTIPLQFSRATMQSLSFETNFIVKQKSHTLLNKSCIWTLEVNMYNNWNNLINIVKINTWFFSLFGFSALLSVALDSKCELSSVSPILDRHLLTVRKLCGLRPCSSVKANVIVLPSPVLKVSIPRKGLESLPHHYCPSIWRVSQGTVRVQFVPSLHESCYVCLPIIRKPGLLWLFHHVFNTKPLSFWSEIFLSIKWDVWVSISTVISNSVFWQADTHDLPHWPSSRPIWVT